MKSANRWEKNAEKMAREIGLLPSDVNFYDFQIKFLSMNLEIMEIRLRTAEKKSQQKRNKK